jgi:ubiquinone biosynthesis protein COQ9
MVTGTPEDLDRVIDGALRLASEHPWAEVTMREIATEAELDLVRMCDVVSSKSEIISAFMHRVDKQMLAEAAPATGDQSPRDALFEVLMSRFDVLAPHRAALKSIAGPQIPDSDLLKAVLQSNIWMLRAAGVEAEGLKGGARVVGLMSVYASVFQTWLEDDDPGLARTMAVLDRRLRRGERTLNSVDSLLGTAEGLCKSLVSLLCSQKRTDPAKPAGSDEPSSSPGNVSPGSKAF